MRKVAIITMTGNKNYGNRLQNYALSNYISNLGLEVYTIWQKNKLIKEILKKIKKGIYLILEELNIKRKKEKKRQDIFEKFTKKNINNYKIKEKDLSNLDKEFDYYVIGSDQVWNPNVINNYLGLKIFDNSNKIISYAPSIGVDIVNDEYKKIVKENFTKEKIKNISVREESGKKIIEDISGRKDVQVLVDPTMLLTSEEWDKVSKRPKQLDNIKEDKYILNYFLGTLSDERKKEIERIATENNCHIINILDKKNPFYATGPSEFLYLEKHAFLICTDSFHSSVFAILYNTPFVVFDREDNIENMSSRIDTLLSKFKLEDRRYTGKITKDLLKHDYTQAYKILEIERNKSKDFLKKALDIEKKKRRYNNV